MTTLRTITVEAARVGVWPRLVDSLVLMKPRMVLMILAVTMAGFYMGSVGTPDWTAATHAWLSRYQAMVLRMPDWNVSAGFHPSSASILLASIA